MPNKIIPYNPALKQLARELRKNSTLGEVLLWQQLKGKPLGAEFHRQVPIDSFIVDFYCHELRLAIEVDGKIHDVRSVREYDVKRQERLEDLGVRFIRIDDEMIRKSLPQALTAIKKKIKELKIPR